MAAAGRMGSCAPIDRGDPDDRARRARLSSSVRQPRAGDDRQAAEPRHHHGLLHDRRRGARVPHRGWLPARRATLPADQHRLHPVRHGGSSRSTSSATIFRTATSATSPGRAEPLCRVPPEHCSDGPRFLEPAAAGHHRDPRQRGDRRRTGGRRDRPASGGRHRL